jgi:hypothetical protein
MRQTRVAGELLFVDYAGTTPEVINGLIGEVITAQLFVAALGHPTPRRPVDAGARRLDRLAHTRFRIRRRGNGDGGNLKSGITQECFYEPTVIRSYAEMVAGALSDRGRSRCLKGKSILSVVRQLPRSGRCRCRRPGAGEWRRPPERRRSGSVRSGTENRKLAVVESAFGLAGTFMRERRKAGDGAAG